MKAVQHAFAVLPLGASAAFISQAHPTHIPLVIPALTPLSIHSLPPVAPHAPNPSATRARISRDSDQAISLSASGGVNGCVGQIGDGQVRVGDHGGSAATFHITGQGTLVDSSGRGCLLTPPTTQLQCDAPDDNPTPGFSIGDNGQLEYKGNPTFYACPATDTAYNIYAQPVKGQAKCVKITLSTSNGKCGGGGGGGGGGAPSSSGPSGPPSSSTPAIPNSPPPYPLPSGSSAPPPDTGSVPGYPTGSVPPPPPPSSSPASSSMPGGPPPGYGTSTAVVPPPESSPPGYPSSPASPPGSTAAPPPSVPPASCSCSESSSPPETPSGAPPPPPPPPPGTSSSGPGPSAPGYPSSPSGPSAPGPGAPGPSSPAPSAPSPSPPSYPSSAPPPNSPSGTLPSPSSPPSTCQPTLTGAYQTPHLIVPICSAAPDTPQHTQYVATINSTVSTIFNFDIPESYAGKTCSIVFLFPQKAQLETSDYAFSGAGSLAFAQLAGVASEQTTWGNAPAVSHTLAEIPVRPGNSYVVASAACPAGTTQSIEVSARGAMDLWFFEDWNPSPIGCYITSC